MWTSVVGDRINRFKFLAANFSSANLVIEVVELDHGISNASVVPESIPVKNLDEQARVHVWLKV